MALGCHRPGLPWGAVGGGAMGQGMSLWGPGGTIGLGLREGLCGAVGAADGRRGAVGVPWVGSAGQGAQRVTWVPQGDSAEEVTRRVCARSPLEPPLRRALCQRVQDELSKRRGTG